MTQPENDPMPLPPHQGTTIAGAAVFGLLLVGVGSILAALIAIVGYQQWTAAAIFAGASAFAFGQLLSGLVRR